VTVVAASVFALASGDDLDAQRVIVDLSASLLVAGIALVLALGPVSALRAASRGAREHAHPTSSTAVRPASDG